MALVSKAYQVLRNLPTKRKRRKGKKRMKKPVTIRVVKIGRFLY